MIALGVVSVEAADWLAGAQNALVLLLRLTGRGLCCRHGFLDSTSHPLATSDSREMWPAPEAVRASDS